MGSMKIEYWRSRFLRQWHFRIKATNGQIIAQSEGYKNKGDCLKTIHSIRDRVGEAVIAEVLK